MLDGDTELVSTEDWNHPSMRAIDAPFLELASGKLTYRCAYENPTDDHITTGESAAKNETCMAIGYLFPTTKSAFCTNSTTLGQP